ncbi:MAG: metallophosphoesterase [Anaerovoracaceae bacterium]|jgi:predicted phosphohydrolase
MSIYVIGDVHLSFDKRIEKPMDVFGGAWKDHARRLEENWRARCTPEDTIIVAGDISWGLKLEEAMADLDWLSSLPGHKVLIKGNHDLWWSGINKLNRLYDNMTFIQNSCYEAEGWYICGTRGWVCPGSDEFTQDDMKIYLREAGRLERSLDAARARGAQHIIGVTHYPPTNDKKQDSEFTRLFSEAGAEVAFYGHLHGSDGFGKGMRGIYNGVRYELVSLDYLDCKLKLVK